MSRLRLRLPVTVPNCNKTGFTSNAAAIPISAAPANGRKCDFDKCWNTIERFHNKHSFRESEEEKKTKSLVEKLHAFYRSSCRHSHIHPGPNPNHVNHHTHDHCSNYVNLNHLPECQQAEVNHMVEHVPMNNHRHLHWIRYHYNSLNVCKKRFK